MRKTYLFFDIEVARDAREVLSMEKPPVIWIFAQAVDAETGEYVGGPFNEKIQFLKDRADKKILDFINYTDDAWAAAKPPAMVANMFSAYVKKYAWFEKQGKHGKFYNAVMAGQNVRNFDVPVLLNWYRGLSTHFSKPFYINTWYYPLVDTLSMLQTYDSVTNTFASSNSLPAVCERLGIDQSQHHSAEDDCRVTIEIWRKVTEAFVTLGTGTTPNTP